MEKYVIEHLKGDWTSDGRCFTFGEREDSQKGRNNSWNGSKSNFRNDSQSVAIQSVCASRVPVRDMSGIGGLWSRIDLENKLILN